MPARILIHVQQLVGHGHLRRMARIADGLAAAGHDVTVASGGMPAADVGPSLARLVQLPAAQAPGGDHGHLVDETGAALDESWYARRWTASRRLVERIRPDLLMVELFPFGRRAFSFELTPLIEGVAAQGGRIAISLRDILVGGRDPVKDEAGARLVRELADMVLVHGDPAIARIEEQIPALKPLEHQLRYTGYVTEASARPTDGPGYGVLVTAGSGVHGAAIMRAAMAARRDGLLADRPWTFVTGPSAPADLLPELIDAAPDGVTVWPSHHALPALIAAAGLVIGLGGYNTVMEALAARRPLIVVPHVAVREDEQLVRARLFAARGLLSLIEPDDLTPASLTAAALTARAPQGQRPDLGGVSGTVAALHTLL